MPSEKFFICQDCGKSILKDVTKQWAKICYPCWKRRQLLGNVPLVVIKEKLNKELEEKEMKARLFSAFREKLDNPKEMINKKLKFLLKMEKYQLNPSDVVSFEMYPIEMNGETIRSKRIECPMYEKECKWHNTRLKINSETRAEIDNLPREQAQLVISEICLALINKGYSFSVFYAEGARSPHIIIYDFEEMNDFDSFEREQLQLNFWRDISPLWTHLDRAVWEDKHFVPLEYAPHWKYGTIFNLLFSYKHEGESCNQ
jgi:hypothetical protein